MIANSATSQVVSRPRFYGQQREWNDPRGHLDHIKEQPDG